jgi:hypothetical protein
MTNCVQCKGKPKPIGATTGTHNLCMACCKQGWTFVTRDDRWHLARNLNTPAKLNETEPLMQQCKVLEKQLRDLRQVIAEIEACYVFPQLTDVTPLGKLSS